MNVAPPVSVVTVVHNGMPYLPATVESVLQQTFRDFEYLIVDDGSTDGTAAFLQSISDERIRIIRRDRIGLIAVRNLTLSEARADYIAIIDADDIAMPSRLQTQLMYLRQHPDCVVVGSNAKLIDQSGEAIGVRNFPLSDYAIRFQMLFGCPFLNPATMCRRASMVACGGYSADFPNAEDYHLWSRLAFAGQMANLPECLIRYRVHPKSMTSRTEAEQSDYCRRIAKSYMGSLGIHASPDVLSELYRFLQYGTSPENAGTHDLAECYRNIRAWFCSHIPVDAELERQFEFIQQRLRWHCLEKASACWHRPLQAWRWVRLAGAFDPEAGSIASMAGRAARKVFRNRTTTT